MLHDPLRLSLDSSELTIGLPSLSAAGCGEAVNVIPLACAGVKPTSAVTTDGGAHWTLAGLKERPASIFFLNDSLGWMVTDKGLWQTEEFGKSWHKLKAPPGLWRVHFLDPDRGWAVGGKKQVFGTRP